MTPSCIAAKIVFTLACSLKSGLLDPMPQRFNPEPVKPTMINGLYYRSLPGAEKTDRLPLPKVEAATLEERMGPFATSFSMLSVTQTWLMPEDPAVEIASVPIPEFRPKRMPTYSEVEETVKRTSPRREPEATVKEVAFAPTMVDKEPSFFERMIRPRDSKPDNKLLYVKADGNEEMGCLHKNPWMMGVLAAAKKKFGATPVVDSGYRSPAHNRRVSGARGSLHMRCLAMDIKVPGVTKDALAAWLRRYPGMGGVGIYASGYVHFDHGRRRDWDWRRTRIAKR